MIREICKDEVFLAQKAELATIEDLPVADDLLDTLRHHREGCVGMAANMIGVNKRIIAFDDEGTYICPLWVFARPAGFSPSRCAGRTKSSRSVSAPLPAGRPRSFSMRSTIVRGSLYEPKSRGCLFGGEVSGWSWD